MFPAIDLLRRRNQAPGEFSELLAGGSAQAAPLAEPLTKHVHADFVYQICTTFWGTLLPPRESAMGA
jgi:hypothetical protein